MPVHNALPYLDQAIESILGQSFADFEFVILDDASTDGSTDRLREWAARDSRIRLLEVTENLGPALSSQFVANAARAPIVARMDADDISNPERLRLQLDVIEQNPDAGVVGCLADLIDSKGQQVRGPEMWRLARRSLLVPFAHGAMMYRKRLFDETGGYRKECVFWEDLDLVTRMARISNVLVIPAALYRVRQSALSTRFISGHDELERALDLMYRSVDRVGQGRDYEDILARSDDIDRKIDPRSYIALGSVILWAGHRPRLFRRLLARGSLSANFASLSAIIWTAWASLSPGTLRPFLLMLVRLRSALAKPAEHPSEHVPWPVRSEARLSGPRAAETGGRAASTLSAGTGSAQNR
jgi:glycosyltransferase involved in cell wall biosynthesis